MSDDTMADLSAASSEAKSTVGSIASDIKVAAVQKFDEALTEVRSKAVDAKGGVADEVQNVATALRRASEELRGGSAQERTLGTIASSLADVSDQIRDKDLGEIVQMVSTAARKNPMLFLGGAALLGFAASRYAKASSDSMAAQTYQQQAGGDFFDEGNPNAQPMYSAT